MTDIAARNADLKQLLVTRRREVQDEVQSRIREGRMDRPREVRDHVDDSDADTQGDLDIALIETKVQMLARIDEALGRLEAGKGGVCRTCGREISERRLRVLPFAVRCQECQGRRDGEPGPVKRLGQPRGRLPRAFDAVPL